MVGVGVIEAFGESVDEYTGIWRVDFDLRIRSVLMVDRQEQVPGRLVRITAVERRSATNSTVFAFLVDEMVAHDRVDLDLSEESTPSLDHAE